MIGALAAGTAGVLAAGGAVHGALYRNSWLFGPALGGALYGIGRAIPFLTDAVSYLVSVLSLFFMRTKFQEDREPVPMHLWADIGEGLRWLWHHPVLRFVALLTGGITAPVVGYALIIIVLAQSQHASPFAIGHPLRVEMRWPLRLLLKGHSCAGSDRRQLAAGLGDAAQAAVRFQQQVAGVEGFGFELGAVAGEKQPVANFIPK